MKIFNIYTVENQEMYCKEDNAMILAHLVDQGKYDASNFDKCKYIIMDNGVYEHAQVSQSLSKLISLVKRSGIAVNEIVIPDVIGDYEKSKMLFEQSMRTMQEYQLCFKFMYVTHAKTIEELQESIVMVNTVSVKTNIQLVLGFPKHSALDRTSTEVINTLKGCTVPIHYLGIISSYSELLPVKGFIRSCDSVQLSYLARDCSVASKDLINKTREKPDIDLAIDKVNAVKLALMRVAVNKELKKNGLLR